MKKECFDTKNIEYLGEKEGSNSSDDETKSDVSPISSPGKRKTH